MNLFFTWLFFSIVSAVLYRASGMGKEDMANPRWIPKFMRQRWFRIWIVPLLSIAVVAFFRRPVWNLLFAGLLLNAAAISTYWDFIFGHDNHIMHGLFCGLALLPLVFAGFSLPAILLRSVVLGLGMGAWSLIIGNDEAEEYGRGLLHTLTIPIIFI